MTTTAQVISQEDLLKHWQGHRNLTRRVIAAFPEKELFDFSIGGMRTFAQLIDELLAIGAPAMKGIINRDEEPYKESTDTPLNKEAYLKKWDEASEEISRYWQLLKPEDFDQTVNLFGIYNFPIIQNILYFIDNETHHRGQGTVYLRALGIEPPHFWER